MPRKSVLEKILEKLKQIPMENWKIEKSRGRKDYSTKFEGKEIKFRSEHFEGKYSSYDCIQLAIINEGTTEYDISSIMSNGAPLDGDNLKEQIKTRKEYLTLYDFEKHLD
jgi:hypothetical protein